MGEYPFHPGWRRIVQELDRLDDAGKDPTGHWLFRNDPRLLTTALAISRELCAGPWSRPNLCDAEKVVLSRLTHQMARSYDAQFKTAEEFLELHLALIAADARERNVRWSMPDVRGITTLEAVVEAMESVIGMVGAG